MKTYRIGVDPGVGGALALLEYEGILAPNCVGEFPKLVEVKDMPVMALNGKKQQVNPAEIRNILTGWQLYSRGSIPDHSGTMDVTHLNVVYIEHVNAMPGQGVTSMFNFGVSYGIIQGVAAALYLPFILVPPRSWKKRAGLLNSEKDRARAMAQQFFPEADLARKKDVGRADAILIAMFGR